MRIIILTQDDNLFLPTSCAYICQELGSRIVYIVVSPALSTHGGLVKGLLRHIALFGASGTVALASRILMAKTCGLAKRPTGKGRIRSIDQVAHEYDIPFRRIRRVNSPPFHEVLEECRPDLLISLSCPQVIGRKVRDRIPAGCINVHGSPLPKYRGLMPAFWVLRNNEPKTAVTVHDLAAKLDDGDILLQREVDIAPTDTWYSLIHKTKAAAAGTLVEAVRQIESGNASRKPNLEEDATYYSFPTAADRRAFLAAGRRFF